MLFSDCNNNMVIGAVITSKAIPAIFHIVQNSSEGNIIKSQSITNVIPLSIVKINGIKYFDLFILVTLRYVPLTDISASQ